MVSQLWQVFQSLGPNCGLKSFLDLLSASTKATAPEFHMLMLFCDATTLLVTYVSMSLECCSTAMLCHQYSHLIIIFALYYFQISLQVIVSIIKKQSSKQIPKYAHFHTLSQNLLSYSTFIISIQQYSHIHNIIQLALLIMNSNILSNISHSGEKSIIRSFIIVS